LCDNRVEAIYRMNKFDNSLITFEKSRSWSLLTKVNDKGEALMILIEYVKAMKGVQGQGKFRHEDEQHLVSSQEPPMQDISDSKHDEEAEKFPALSTNSKLTKGTKLCENYVVNSKPIIDPNTIKKRVCNGSYISEFIEESEQGEYDKESKGFPSKISSMKDYVVVEK
jgi:hypothetical protein